MATTLEQILEAQRLTLVGVQKLTDSLTAAGLIGTVVIFEGNLPGIEDIPTAPQPPAPKSATDAFWEHEPPAVQALRGLTPGSPERRAAAYALAAQGYPILDRIHIYNGNPKQILEQFVNAGYTWLATITNTASNVMSPGFDPIPGWVAYDPANPPEGAFMIDMSIFDGTVD